MFNTVIIFLSFFSFFSYSATLTIPENLQLLKVNGQEYSTSLFERKVQLDLAAGEHVLLLRYKEMYEDDDNDDHTTIKSSPFLLMFDIANEPLRITPISFPEESAARAFAKKPTVTLENMLAVKVASKSLLLSDFEQHQYKAALALKQNILAATQSEKSAHLTPKHSAQKADVIKNSRAIEMLNYWWQQASEHEQQQFIEQHRLKKE